MTDAPILFRTAKAFEAWLKKHHAGSDGLWLQIAKKGADEPSVSYPEAVEIALCWGWIDGQKRSLDAQHFLQRFTPRRARSLWSKINVEKASALIACGRMQPPGQAQIDAAKADGRWARAYDGATHGRGTGGSVGGAGRIPRREEVLRDRRCDEPLRGALARADGGQAPDAEQADRAAGGDAGEGRGAAPILDGEDLKRQPSPPPSGFGSGHANQFVGA
jgi:hypothetical protein